MTPRPALRLLALALALPALLAPVAAHAEKVVTEDAVGDAVSLAEEAFETIVPAPDEAGVDIVRTGVAHGSKRLRVTVHYRAMRRDPFHLTFMAIATADSKFELVVERLGGKPIASIAGRREDIECQGLKAQVDLGADVLTASLPTSCLDSPRWVRVGVAAIAVSEDTSTPEGVAAHADDAHRAGEVRDRIALGPKVRRG